MRIVPLSPHTQGGEGPEGRGYILLSPHMHVGGEGPGDEAMYSLPLICMGGGTWGRGYVLLTPHMHAMGPSSQVIWAWEQGYFSSYPR